MQRNFNDCNALIYDTEGVQVASVKIKQYHKQENYIELQDSHALISGKQYEVLILTTPMPYVYHGRFQKLGGEMVIRLYKEKRRENRRETRYKVNLRTHISCLIYDEKLHSLHTPLKAQLLNISKSGMRFRAVYNALTVGNKFQMHMRIGNDDKVLTAEVVFCLDSPPEYSEFGCRLITREGN